MPAGTAAHLLQRPRAHSCLLQRPAVPAWTGRHARSCARRRHLRTTAAAAHAEPAPSALQQSTRIAAARARETRRADRLLGDPYAEALAAHDAAKDDDATTLLDVIAARFVNDALLNAAGATSVNSIQGGDYSQVVLLGDALDTRAFCLPWPAGTVLFVVAPRDAHSAAVERLAGTAAAPPQGCLLRRVELDMRAALMLNDASDNDTNLLPALQRAGFRPDRLSAWALAGGALAGLGAPELRVLLGDVASAASYHSLLCGELPGPLGRGAAENLLAEAGLLGAVLAHGGAATGGGYGRWDAAAFGAPAGEGAVPSAAAPRWLFSAQQQRPSLAQEEMYYAAVEAAEGADEDILPDYS